MLRHFARATRLLVIGAALLLVRLLHARRRESFGRGGRITRLVTVGAIVCTLASGALAFAAGQRAPDPAAKPSAAPAQPTVLVVPDVRGQAYTFAKGMLEDAGFAWSVMGDVGGHAANSVVSQTPLPGTRVYDTGFPIVTLALERSSSYTEGGTPQNASPYPGTPVELVGGGAAASTPARPPAFDVVGAPPETADQSSLPERAQRLARWIETHRTPTRANASHWRYEHAWIVAGAKSGWWRGADALETLIRVDRRVEALWDMGSKRRAATTLVLAEVRKASR